MKKQLTSHHFFLSLIICYGGFLRFWGIDRNQIFADEIHTLKCAVEKNFLWISTHFGTQDTCIPLTLYNKFFIETIGLNAWIFRMPSLICGTILLLAISRFLLKHFSSAEQILAIGAIAVSPYFVYMSREARPYIIITLFIWLALVLAMKWRTSRNASDIIWASVFSALAMYFHPVVLPVIICIGLYPILILLNENAPKNHWNQIVVAAILFLIITSCLMIPSALSLLDGISHKGGKGIAGLDTVKNGLGLLHGLPIHFPIYVWGLLLIFGITSFFKRFPHETSLIVLAAVFQLAVLFLWQPRKMEIPWVWLRYVAPLLPWFLICCMTGFISFISFFNPLKNNKILTFCGIIIIFSWTTWHLSQRNYGIFPTSSYNVHPMILLIDKSRTEIEKFSPVAYFYDNLPDFLVKGRIVEAPMLFTFPLYLFYHYKRNADYQTTGLGSGYGQQVFQNHEGFNFKTVFSLSKNKIRIKHRNDNKYVIVHKRIAEEMTAAYEYFSHKKMPSEQLTGLAYLFTPSALDSLFGSDDLMKLKIQWPKVYEDEWLAVYKLGL